MLSTIAAHCITILAFWPGTWEWVIIALVVLLLFGGKKLPELARGLAKGLKGFKEEMHGIEKEVDDVKKSVTEEPPADKAAGTDSSEPQTGEDGTGN